MSARRRVLSAVVPWEKGVRPLFVSALLGAALLSAACGASRSASEVEAAPAPSRSPGVDAVLALDPKMLAHITVEPVSEQRIAHTLVVAGKVQFDEDRVARVLVPLAGQVVGLHAKVGDPIVKGQTLCAISSREAAAVIGEHIESHKDLDLAEKTAAMTDDLFQHEAASRLALQQAQSDLAKARTRVARTEEAVHVLGLPEAVDLTQFDGRVPIVAPISGVLIDRRVTEGQFVPADATPVLTIADSRTVWVMGDLFERDLPLVSIGQAAVISTAAYPGERFAGRIDYISDAIDPATRAAKIRVSVTNRGARLKAEMFATVSLDVSRDERAITLPSRALLTEDGRTFVYAQVGEGRFARREVMIALHDGATIRVTGGVRAGDRVVVDGVLLLRQEEEQRAAR